MVKAGEPLPLEIIARQSPACEHLAVFKYSTEHSVYKHTASIHFQGASK